MTVVKMAWRNMNESRTVFGAHTIAIAIKKKTKIIYFTASVPAVFRQMIEI